MANTVNTYSFNTRPTRQQSNAPSYRYLKNEPSGKGAARRPENASSAVIVKIPASSAYLSRSSASGVLSNTGAAKKTGMMPSTRVASGSSTLFSSLVASSTKSSPFASLITDSGPSLLGSISSAVVQTSGGTSMMSRLFTTPTNSMPSLMEEGIRQYQLIDSYRKQSPGLLSASASIYRKVGSLTAGTAQLFNQLF